MYQGGGDVISPGSVTDGKAHLYTCEFRGDRNSIFTVSGVGSIEGDVGGDGWDIMSLFGNSVGIELMEGWIGEFVAYNKQLSAEELANAQLFLQDKWQIT